MVLLAFAERIAHEFPDFQILYAVHRNTAHSHVHFVMNSVCITDGHKFSQGPAEMEKFKESVGTYEQAFNLGEGCVEYYETDLDDGEWESENLYDNIPEMPTLEDRDDYEEDESCNTLEEPMDFWNPTGLKQRIFNCRIPSATEKGSTRGFRLTERAKNQLTLGFPLIKTAKNQSIRLLFMRSERAPEVGGNPKWH